MRSVLPVRMFPPKAGKPNKGEQMVRYDGYYSNVSRGRRKKEVWPWVTEMVAVAWKHPNVYLEIGAVSPKYIGTPGTGWEPLMVYGNSLLQDRVLFATDNMLPHARCVEELKALPLKESVKAKWLGLNACKILK